VLTATDFTAQLWDATGTSGKAAFVWTPGAQIYHATFSPDGAYLSTRGGENSLEIIKANDDITISNNLRHAASARERPHPGARP
jgi:hypothetical protein